MRTISGAVAVILAVTMVLISIPKMEASIAVHNFASPAFHRPRVSQQAWSVLRGGADVMEEDEYDFDEEEEDDEEEETLAASTRKATEKAQAIKTAEVKKVVSSKMSKKKKHSKKSLLQLLRVPYIIRATLNPFTLIAMTKGYWGSLFNLNYLQEDASQGLRSALEEKAKKSASGGGGRKSKRKMKPGQARTLSDLPQLNT